MTDDWPGDLTDDEIVAGMMGHKVRFQQDGEKLTFNPDVGKQDVTLTSFQAYLIIDALSEFQADSYVQTELARRTRDRLQKRFDDE